MDYLFTRDAKPITETNNVGTGSCEKEEEDIDVDFVLKFSTDESDCEDAAHSNDNYINSPITACDDLVKNCSDSLSMQKKPRLSTYALRYDKITNTTRSVRRRSAKSKVIINQRSVLDYFSRRDIDPDNKVADEIRKDPKADAIVETQKLTRQLLNARVILERLPDSLLVKNDEHDNDDYQETLTCMIKRFCTSCDRTFIRASNKCLYCNSVLKYECAKCGTRYSSRQGLKYHQKTKCCSRPVYRYSQWNYLSPTKIYFKKHIEAVHIQSNGGKTLSFNCWQCSEKFSYYRELIQHEKVCKLTDAKLAAVRRNYAELLSREDNFIASIDENKNGKKRKLSSCEILDGPTYKKARLDAVAERLKLIRAFCPKCPKTKVLKDTRRTCWNRRCMSALRYECTSCKKQYFTYSGILYHIDSNCPSMCQIRRNLLQCNKCSFVSHTRREMYH